MCHHKEAGQSSNDARSQGPGKRLNLEAERRRYYKPTSAIMTRPHLVFPSRFKWVAGECATQAEDRPKVASRDACDRREYRDSF